MQALNGTLVIVFDLGVAGVAIGTCCSQFISCVLVSSLSASFGSEVISSDFQS